jgi:hypothetical protein
VSDFAEYRHPNTGYKKHVPARYTDGIYRFWFTGYSTEDLGTYTYEDGILTLTDVNGKESFGEGEDPIKLHYAYSASDQLTGDYTIPASTFEFAK